MRRALAGLMWTKQHYRFRTREWLDGDPAQPAAPKSRTTPHARNAHWRHFDVADVISMPDEWSTRGSPRGTSRSRRCRSPGWTRRSPRSNCSCCAGSG
ncbi:hypothetical protein K7G98_26190 [Saccharothrix sp. MB29]|nr:hypothetical protein [Saccharothrix sp. MB29]